MTGQSNLTQNADVNIVFLSEISAVASWPEPRCGDQRDHDAARASFSCIVQFEIVYLIFFNNLSLSPMQPLSSNFLERRN